MGSESRVSACVWSSDGHRVASGSYDGTVSLRHTGTGRKAGPRCVRSTDRGTTWGAGYCHTHRILAWHRSAWLILGWRTTHPDGFPFIPPAENRWLSPVSGSWENVDHATPD